ncbi:MAG: lipoyl synthase [Candidatus Margulisbacteria bacterium]|nr:lipoyl synthase [Candidatus Margulisiibacteriota bacterium]
MQKLPYPINTVCEEAKCPNRGECFSKKTVTFLLLGKTCTRNCLFCGIDKGTPDTLQENEPDKILAAIKHFALRYVVLTSVTRDDLKDGGSGEFVNVMQKINDYNPDIKIEVLVPDFQGNWEAINKVCELKPFVFNHNLELVPNIFKTYRPLGNFDLSLDILKYVKKNYQHLHVKTGIMVGLGETKEEVVQLIKLLGSLGIDILTIGQYLQPSKKCAEVKRFVLPEEFLEYEKSGESWGIKVIAGPLVRSSYMAEAVLYDKITNKHE